MKISFLLLLVGVVFIMALIDSRCRACGRYWAVHGTGKKKRGGWLYPEQKEHKCQYCGHSKWEFSSDD